MKHFQNIRLLIREKNLFFTTAHKVHPDYSHTSVQNSNGRANIFFFFIFLFFWMCNIFLNFSPPSLSYLSILLYDHFLIRISKHLIDSSKKNVFSINLFYFYIKYKLEKIKKADCWQSNMPIWTFCNSSKLNQLFLFYSFSITSQPHLKMVTISTYDPIKMKTFTVTGPR